MIEPNQQADWPSRPKRRWLRFGLGTLLMLVWACAIALGWFEVQRQWVRDRHEAIDWLEARGRYARLDGYSTHPEYPKVPWILQKFGEPNFVLIHIENEDPADNRYLVDRGREFQRLFPEARVEIREPGGKDVTLARD